MRRAPSAGVHLIIALADHFEPSIMPGRPGTFAPRDEQLRRLKRWCAEYPGAVDRWRDSDGRPFKHTHFSPAEQYDKEQIDVLAEHCRGGWGEVEVHLHHGIQSADTAENTRQMLSGFRDALVKHGCLAKDKVTGEVRYGFVHGNWALANSANGKYCGVDSEMQVLADTGCYGDFTLPSAPSAAQTAKINSLYECGAPLEEQAPHRTGTDLRMGVAPSVFPLIVQGPLTLDLERKKIDNSELSGPNPATLHRLRLWKNAAICVEGRQDWVFIKLHCHGMDPRDESAMFGSAMQDFLRQLSEKRHGDDALHYVSCREMTNIILAACDGKSGNPAEFRDYRFVLNA
jgi:hypothetical protein